MALRLRGTKTELEAAGEDVDGMAESTSQLQAKLKALTHGKVDIMLDENTFKNTTEILREMSKEWENMTDIEQASALELMGGKRQACKIAWTYRNIRKRIHLIAGNSWELFTTIIRKLDYDGFKTKRLDVHAAKLLSDLSYGECSSTRAMSARTSQAYGGGKGVLLTGNAEDEEIVNSYMKI